MSRDFRLYIVDIFIAINKTNRYTHEITDAQSLRWNEILWDATIRELEIIGESTRVLIESDFLNNRATCKFNPSKQLNCSHNDFRD